MQTQQVEQVGCVYKRIKKGRGRKYFDFERKPAIKKPGPDGSVLLQPLPAVSSANRRSFITVTLAEGVTVQLATKQNGQSQEPCAPRNDGSAQCSPLIIGTRKQAGVGPKLKF